MLAGSTIARVVQVSLMAKDQTVPQMDFCWSTGRQPAAKAETFVGCMADCPLNGLSPDSSKTSPHRESLQQAGA